MIYHGRFNAARFNVVEQPTDILLRELCTEAADADAVQTNYIVEDVGGDAVFSSETTLAEVYETSAEAEESTGGAFDLLPVLFLTLTRRRGFNQERFNRQYFNRTHEEERPYIHIPTALREELSGVRPLAENQIAEITPGTAWFSALAPGMTAVYPTEAHAEDALSASTPVLLPTLPVSGAWEEDVGAEEARITNVIQETLAAGTGFCFVPPALTALYSLSAVLGGSLWTETAELLPTIPLALRKIRDLPGFNSLPFDAGRERAFEVVPLTWREDFGAGRVPFFGQLDGAAELSEALDGVLRLFLDCSVSGTLAETLALALDFALSVPFGLLRIRRRGFNRAYYDRKRFNLEFSDRFVPHSYTWGAAFNGEAAGRIVPVGGAIDAERLKAILAATGFPVAYDHFISAPDLPFIVYMRETSPNFHADNRVWRKINRWNIYLCTELKSREAERVLENVLDLFEIAYEVIDELYIKDECLYQIIYEFEELEV